MSVTLNHHHYQVYMCTVLLSFTEMLQEMKDLTFAYQCSVHTGDVQLKGRHM